MADICSYRDTICMCQGFQYKSHDSSNIRYGRVFLGFRVGDLISLFALFSPIVPNSSVSKLFTYLSISQLFTIRVIFYARWSAVFVHRKHLSLLFYCYPFAVSLPFVVSTKHPTAFAGVAFCHHKLNIIFKVTEVFAGKNFQAGLSVDLCLLKVIVVVSLEGCGVHFDD